MVHKSSELPEDIHKTQPRTALPPAPAEQGDCLTLGWLSRTVQHELHRQSSPVTHPDPNTLDLDDLIRRAVTNRSRQPVTKW